MLCKSTDFSRHVGRIIDYVTVCLAKWKILLLDSLIHYEILPGVVITSKK